MEAMAWKTLSGNLKFRDTVLGTGTPIRKGMKVQMHYTGKLTKNGRQFDSSVGRGPLTFRYGAGEVIKGWDMGMEGMKEGGKRTLVIPSVLGYGKRGAGRDIPPNSDLTFDVHLVRCR
jgi:FKBP-type peptidyl-prolyl cis-trans isomerase FkpA